MSVHNRERRKVRQKRRQSLAVNPVEAVRAMKHGKRRLAKGTR